MDRAADGFATVRAAWARTQTVVLTLPMRVRASVRTTFANGNQDIGRYDPEKSPWARFPGQNGTSGLPFCVVEFGPLTFALPLERGSVQHRSRGGRHNYALDCDGATMSVARAGGALARPFDWPLDAPLKITARAKQFAWPDVWSLPNHTVAMAPRVPQRRATATGAGPTEPAALGPWESIELVPYGSAKQFHISMFPVLRA